MAAPGDHVLVGVSGGADSVCLLRVLALLSEEMSFTLQAVHVHHGIRAAADHDAAFTQQLCGRLGIPLEVVRVDAPAYAAEHGVGLEEAARILRYEAFERVRAACGGSCRIATAHHLEDQAETVLFHAARGSSIRGLTGIRPVNGHLIRPLLHISRQEIECWLNSMQTGWCEDETNADTEFTRNCIRREILPAMNTKINKGTIRHLAQLADEAAVMDDYLSLKTREAFDACVCAGTKNGVKVLSVQALCGLHEAIRQRVLLELMAQTAGRRKDLEKVHVDTIWRICKDTSGSTAVSLPYGMTAVREYDHLYLLCDSEKETKTADAATVENGGRYHVSVFSFDGDMDQIPRVTYTKWFDYDKIHSLPVFRTRKEGDYMVISRSGHKKTLHRCMIDWKIPAGRRDHMILPAIGSRILWVPGCRMDLGYQIGKDTSTVLSLTWTGPPEHPWESSAGAVDTQEKRDIIVERSKHGRNSNPDDQ